MGNMNASIGNLEHAIADKCSDPDCELHNPEVIEDGPARLTALAWYMCGVKELASRLDEINAGDPTIIAHAVVGIRHDRKVSIDNPSEYRQKHIGEAVDAYDQGLITHDELVDRLSNLDKLDS